jgi:heat shock protein HslJ
VLGSQRFNFATYGPSKGPGHPQIEIPVGGRTPQTATGSCGPGTPPSTGRYRFSDLHVEQSRIAPVLAGTLTWATDEPPLDQSCIATLTMPDGNTDTYPFTLAVGRKSELHVLLPDRFADAAPLDISCEPYTGPGETTHGAVEGSSPTPASVVWTTWQLTAIDGESVPELRRPITLIFSRDRLGGFDGCNAYGGGYEVRDGTLDARWISSTLIGCEQEIMNRSKALLERLTDAEVGIEETTLTLTSDAGTATFGRLDLQGPTDPTAALDCAPDDRVPVVPHTKTILEPAPPSYISVNLSGIRRSELVRISGSADPAGPSTWNVTRDGQVIGVVQVPTLDGTACRGSGIEGV